MLASVCRRRLPHEVTLPHLPPRCGTASVQTRRYAQQKTPRPPRSAPQRSRTGPTPSTHVKNRPPPPSSPSASNLSKNASPTGASPVVDGKELAQLHRKQMMRELEESGDQLEMLRLSHASGVDPWSNKAAVLDLRIPTKVDSFQALKDNLRNDFQNLLSMYRLAGDFAFPGIVTKWRFSPQLFRTKSTSEKAWVAPFRHDLVEVYKRVNEAIASGDKKTLKSLTAYDYQSHSYRLLQRSLERKKQTGLTAHWSLHTLLSPVQILSLRGFPLYSAPEEPRYGNRNVVQALVRFESLQTLVLRDAKGRIVRPDGRVIEEEEGKGKGGGTGERAWSPDPRRVLEYLVCENKMFYPDGWYIRDQMFEGVKPKFSEAV